ncbi:hypothetical protein UFOVP244_152 [uncultured Caudovirales phage]|uniref:Uncharacterized protein n=1 Tax=uncultured Caudovirales phage TaxID=2100421 RepID=A0A6J7WUD9_9CAUD|nr:hypothetical protein UFOVP244_152 [uncultured Caudovirales phage]
MRFFDLQYEYLAYVNGQLIERKYGSTITKVRKNLLYLMRKHNDLVFYQIFKLSHRNYGSERRNLETGWVDIEGRFRKTYIRDDRVVRKRVTSTK